MADERAGAFTPTTEVSDTQGGALGRAPILPAEDRRFGGSTHLLQSEPNTPRPINVKDFENLKAPRVFFAETVGIEGEAPETLPSPEEQVRADIAQSAESLKGVPAEQLELAQNFYEAQSLIAAAIAMQHNRQVHLGEMDYVLLNDIVDAVEKRLKRAGELSNSLWSGEQAAKYSRNFTNFGKVFSAEIQSEVRINNSHPQMVQAIKGLSGLLKMPCNVDRYALAYFDALQSQGGINSLIYPAVKS